MIIEQLSLKLKLQTEHTGKKQFTERKKEKVNKNNQIGKGASYIKMTPTEFLKLKKTSKVKEAPKILTKQMRSRQTADVKKKWITFKL